MSGFGGSGGGGGGGPTTIASPLGNHTKAESVSVTLSTNEPAVPVSGTVTANIGTSGSLALDTTVSNMNAKLPSTAALTDATANPTTTSIGIFGHIFNGTTWDRIRGGINTAVSSVTGWLNVLPGGKYNASQATLTDGQYTVAQLDSLGNQRNSEQFAPVAEDNTNGVIAVQIKPLTVSTYAPSITNDWGSNVTLNIKASAGTTFSAIGVNRNAGTRYLQLHNTATTPSAAAVPLISFPVPTNSILFIGNDLLTNNGIFFSTGIAYGWSTTAGTYTAATASEHDTTMLFK